eukprot:TRINITY_DN1219_c0_g1_i1.p1 TRINITY_DN1219_c0_g1~~TRINITY_DN1219_c0_g1_i1.p1  ORF type:complete len:506 (+),score=131.02 TRINITY_DN1219_c0_g1_i1:191-1708(+)
MQKVAATDSSKSSVCETKQPTTCGLCEKPAAYTCPDCTANLCQEFCEACYKETHDSNKLLSKHKAYRVASSASEICKEHSTEPTKLFCTKDKALICPQCCLGTHRGHEVKLVEEAASDSNKLVQASISILRNDLKRLEEQLVTQTKKLASLESNSVRARQAVRSRIDSMINDLKLRERELCAEIQSETETKANVLTLKRNKLAATIGQLNASIDESSRLMTKGPLDILHNYQAAHTRYVNAHEMALNWTDVPVSDSVPEKKTDLTSASTSASSPSLSTTTSSSSSSSLSAPLSTPITRTISLTEEIDPTILPSFPSEKTLKLSIHSYGLIPRTEATDSSTTDTKESASSSSTSHASSGSSSRITSFIIGGGGDGTAHLASCSKYDAKTQAWSSIANMNDTRSYASMVWAEGYVYCIGGLNGTGSLATMERYDESSDSWTLLKSMPRARYGHAACYANGKIYVFGGYADTEYLSEMIVYDIQSNTWSKSDSMENKRIYTTGASLCS